MIPEVLTVSQLNRLAREVLQQNFPLFWVGGEISNLARANSGHVYFSLKDESSQVRCVMFRNRAQSVPWRLENGQQIEAQVLVTLYEARGDFQLSVEGLRRAGIGALYEAYARLRELLEIEGLFAPESKRPLPRFPGRVGIISSPQAVALHDIVTTLRRRAAHLPVILYPTPVQGDGAAAKIAAAILLAAERSECDVLIVARGGGSIEDLWAFNEESVARAITACSFPVISGIGHETDTTIADLVADLRAPTPTAAAELITAGWFAAAHELATLGRSLSRILRSSVESRMQRLDLLAHRLLHPGAQVRQDRQLVAHLSTRLHGALAKRLRHHAIPLERWRWHLRQARPATQAQASRLALISQKLSAAAASCLAGQRQRLGGLAAALAQLSPQATLERGYSIVRGSNGKVVNGSDQVAIGDVVELRFAQGWANGRIVQRR